MCRHAITSQINFHPDRCARLYAMPQHHCTRRCENFRAFCLSAYIRRKTARASYTRQYGDAPSHNCEMQWPTVCQ